MADVPRPPVRALLRLDEDRVIPHALPGDGLTVIKGDCWAALAEVCALLSAVLVGTEFA